MKKALILFAAMLLPVCIFMFLKFFGKNEFAVEPMFQQADSTLVINCDIQFVYPYTISQEKLNSLTQSSNALLHAFAFNQQPDIAKDFADRLRAKFSTNEISFQVFAQADTISKKNFKNFELLMLSANDIEQNKNCVFLLAGKNNAVLVDNQGNIRGQYQLGDLDEEDRFLVEATIILKKY
ncbi:MAG: hypothetical protein MUF68_01090 [Cyclobacteriaceae bacterium]|jgi:hypothetical protein|nr:hypothetical protein [Cyclobacteriaceae bacterium]